MAPRFVYLLAGSISLVMIAGCAGFRNQDLQSVNYEEPVFIRPVAVMSESRFVSQNQANIPPKSNDGPGFHSPNAAYVRVLEPEVWEPGTPLQEFLPHDRKLAAFGPPIIAASLQSPGSDDQPRNIARQDQDSLKPPPKDEPLVEA